MNRISRKGIKCNWFTILIIVYLHKNLNLISDKKPVVQFIEYRPLVCLQYIDDNVVVWYQKHHCDVSATPLITECWYQFCDFTYTYYLLALEIHYLNTCTYWTLQKISFLGGGVVLYIETAVFFSIFHPTYYTREPTIHETWR